MRIAFLVPLSLWLVGACAETPNRSLDGRDGGGALLDHGVFDQPAHVDQGHLDTHRPPADTAPATLDGAASFDGVPGTFTKTFDGRSYTLFVPNGYRATAPIPCVLALHGAGDSGATFFATLNASGVSAAAGPARFILVVPETKSPLHDFAIWSGTMLDDVPAMRGELDSLLALIDDLGKHYRLDPRQLHAFGFSDGGAFAAIAGFSHTERLASLSVLGYGWGGDGYPLVTPARAIAVQFVVGTSDSFHALAQASSAFLQARGHETRFLAASGVGHRFSGLLQAHPMGDLLTWMLQHPLP